MIKLKKNDYFTKYLQSRSTVIELLALVAGAQKFIPKNNWKFPEI
jgi:hypothetical protein